MTGPSHVILGGGLASGLAAQALADQDTGPDVPLIESGRPIGPVEVDERDVLLADRHVVEGDIVLHARGPDRCASPGAGRGYRRFVGLEIEDDGL